MTTADYITRLRTDRRAQPRPESIDRRGRVPVLVSPWVRLAGEKRLPAGGAMPATRER